MIRGKVDASRQAWVSIEVMGPDGRFETIDFILDTGFTGSLTLTPEIIGKLGLVWADTIEVTLAGGGQEWWDSWIGQVIWHQGVIPTQVLQSNGTPLLGMELLEDSQLTVQVQEAGEVVIEELQRPDA